MISVLAHAGHDHDLMATAPILAGLIGGAAHVMMGPDHVAAVAPTAIERPRRSWLSGVMWGLGHSAGLWVLAVIAFVFRAALPYDLISTFSDRLIGAVLIAIGLLAFRRVLMLRVHSHAHHHDHSRDHSHDRSHDHGGGHTPHTHAHAHTVPVRDRAAHERDHASRTHHHGMLGIGALHGIAGTSHLLGILPALAMPDTASTVGYLVAFGVGSIGGMGVVAAGLGGLARATRRSGQALSRVLLGVSGAAAVLIGICWLVPA